MLCIKWELKHTKIIAPSRNYIRGIMFSSSARYHQQHGIITHCIMLEHVWEWYLSKHGKSSFHMLDLIGKCTQICLRNFILSTGILFKTVGIGNNIVLLGGTSRVTYKQETHTRYDFHILMYKHNFQEHLILIHMGTHDNCWFYKTLNTNGCTGVITWITNTY